ncbi:MAG: hypothetical protein ACKVP0_10595 [Pirellulaceae bacterium]
MSTQRTTFSLKQVRALVDEMRTFIDSPDHTNSPRITELAASYAEASRDGNARLQRCSDLLQKGHRTEALQLAEAEPDLLALIPVLAFPEIQKWQECAANYGWERAPAIKTEVAAVLSDAYALQRQLHPHLARHRRLALAKASTAERLAVMREIFKIDRTTAFWREDIVVFEAKRAQELAPLGEGAINAQDFSLLDQFVREFKSEEWCAPPPDGLMSLNAVAVSLLHIQRTLPHLAAEINGSLRQQNVPRTLSLLQQWNTIVADVSHTKTGWQPPAELSNYVRPAQELSQRVAEEQRVAAYQVDLQELGLALQGEGSQDEIALLTAKVESHGMGIPLGMRKSLSEHRQTEATSGALNTALIVSVLLAGIVLVLVVFLLVRSMLKSG